MEQKITLPESYWSKLDLVDTEKAIWIIRDAFEKALSEQLNLVKVQAPILVRPETGLNDDLNGVEHAAEVNLRNLNISTQVVQSLAKWKRFALKKYGFPPHTGLYTNMIAIRPDEEADPLHSVTVDQWDWERIILKEERTIETLQETAEKIIKALTQAQKEVTDAYPSLRKFLEPELYVVTTQELEDLYPDLPPQQREKQICKAHKTVLLLQIGDNLKGGSPHDGRAPDYDDWSLNGDLLIWSDVLKSQVEISSMGIRADADSLKKQLEAAGCPEKAELPFHKMVLENKLPLTIGGGIGISRVCMLLLEKVHIGEVQASVWPAEDVEECERKGIHLL